MFKQEEIIIANKTARANGSVGYKAITPKYISTIATKNDSILDFGSGPKAIHTIQLREIGFNVTAYDFGMNVTDIHDSNALNKKYNIVFASNVLNTLSTEESLYQTIQQMINCTQNKLIVNVPASPRKLQSNPKDTHKLVLEYLKNNFKTVKIVGGTKSAPIIEATNIIKMEGN